MGKLKELWERLKSWVNGGSVKRIGYETDEQALDAFVDEEIEKMMALMEKDNPIKDPKKEKVLKAKLKKEMLASAKGLAGLDEDTQSKENEVETNKSQEKAEDIKEREDKKLDPKNIGYQDRLAVIQDMKMKMYKDQKRDERGVADLKYMEAILRLEKELLDDVEKLPEDSEEKQAFVKQREKYMSQELDAKKQAEEKFNQRNQEFASLVTEVAAVREEMEALGKKLDEGTISYEQFAKENAKHQDRLEECLQDIDDLRPDELTEDAKALDARDIMEAKILGGSHRTRAIREASSRELASKIKSSHEKDAKAKYRIESNEMYFQMHGVREIVENLKKHLEEINKEKDELKQRVENGDASYVELERYIDLSERAAAASNELAQYESLDETLTTREKGDAKVIAQTQSDIEKGNDEIAENFEEARDALEELGEEVGENSLEDPAQLEENNNLSPAERLEAEVRRNLGLDNYEPPINEEEVKKRRELEKALEEAEREAEQSGARVRK